jgi:flagellar basal-body rod modification protein FlgD
MASTNSVQGNAAAGFASLNATAAAAKQDETAERFLTLLVAQIRNQDPLNPLDNHQVTTQMAQINTVNGIEKLNRTVSALGTQFASLQVMQGASLVGRDVTVPGDRLELVDGSAAGGFELAGPADRGRVEVLNGAGQVIDTLQLGAQSSGRQAFEWTPKTAPAAGELRFRVVATSGTAAVTASHLMRDRVEAVSADGDTLTLELARSGRLAWADVRAFN